MVVTDDDLRADAGRVILRVTRQAAGLVELLESTLGSVQSLSRLEVEAIVASRPPEPDSPLARGLAWLSERARNLHASAGGGLSGPELTEVAVRRRQPEGPLAYDPETGVVTLDLDHDGVARALATDDGPGRTALLAMMFGIVNRAHERITDQDELHLVGTLLRESRSR